MIAVVKKYVKAIVSSQQSDGWICPCCEEDCAEHDTWAVLLINKVLTVYYECSKGEEIPPVTIITQVKEIDWGKEDGYEDFCAKVPASTKPISVIVFIGIAKPLFNYI